MKNLDIANTPEVLSVMYITHIVTFPDSRRDHNIFATDYETLQNINDFKLSSGDPTSADNVLQGSILPQYGVV